MGIFSHWYILLIMLLFWGAIILALVLLIRWVAPRSTAPVSQRARALEELDLRYARGEINRAEYLERRTDLGGGLPPQSTSPPPAPS